MTGASNRSTLSADLANSVPDGATYVIVLFDGLGIAQLTHHDAGPLRDANRGVINSPFPTTTSVALATVATGMDPAEHGVTGHLMWLPEVGRVVNTLKWVDLAGAPVPHDYPSLLPSNNLWERLRANGVEPITVQPAAFQGSPLSGVLYRGARFEPAWDDRDLVEATVQLATVARRFIFTYFWQVDFAGHVHGLDSPEFARAMREAAELWEQLATRLPPDVALVGTADHGLIQYSDADKIVIREERFSSLRFAGDARGVQIWGDAGLIAQFAEATGGRSVDPAELYGGKAPDNVGDRIVLAPPNKVILPPGFDKRLRAYHGGLDQAEVEVPLLVG